MKTKKHISDTYDQSRSLRIRRLLDDGNWRVNDKTKQRVLLAVLVFILLVLAVLMAYPVVDELTAFWTQ